MSKTRSLYSLFILFSIFFISCSNDDESTTIQENEENAPLIISQTIELQFDQDGNPLPRQIVFEGDIIENKLQNLQRLVYEDGELIKDTIHVIVEYDTQNRLILQNRVDQASHRLHYDANKKLSGIDWKPVNLDMVYFKITHVSDTLVYYERYEEPYSNPNAQITWRIVLKFNENDEIVKAGFDHNFDGQLDTVNTFTYNNGNLISLTNSDSEVLDITYTDIIDTKTYITQNSFGKKELKILNGEVYGRAIIDWFEKVGRFYNVPQKALGISTFEIHNSGFYSKRTTITQNNGAGINTTEIESYEFSSN